MADIAIWNGQSTFTTGSTPLGFYDTDPDFQQDADKVAQYCATRLGYPLMDVELQSGSFYAAFEDAVTTYGNEVFQYKVRENYLSMEGASTGSSFNNRLIEPNLNRLMQISENYGTEAMVGGKVDLKQGQITLQEGQQVYDLDQWAEDEGIVDGIEIRRIFYQAPPAILRYFDPYAGTGTGVQSLMDAFGFGSFSPGVNFLLMPASFDVMKIQAIEFNDQIRKSSYSFQLNNNKLRIFPVPTQTKVLFFDYYDLGEKQGSLLSADTNLVSNTFEVPYSNPQYSRINSIGRQWIRKYALAVAKEMLGYIRGKYQTVPVPGAETTLNQADLLADARSEQLALIESLRETLEQTSRQSQLERKSNESKFIGDTLKDIPFTIYVG